MPLGAECELPWPAPHGTEKKMCVLIGVRVAGEPSLLMVPVNQLSKSGQQEVSRSSPMQRYSGNPGSRARVGMSCSMLGCLLKICTVPSNQLTDTMKQFELERNVISSQKNLNTGVERTQERTQSSSRDLVLGECWGHRS